MAQLCARIHLVDLGHSRARPGTRRRGGRRAIGQLANRPDRAAEQRCVVVVRAAQRGIPVSIVIAYIAVAVVEVSIASFIVSPGLGATLPSAIMTALRWIDATALTDPAP